VSEMRRFTTDEQRQWLFSARRRGGLCAACGRALHDGESVYIEPVVVELKYASAASPRSTSTRDACLGQECASRAFVERASILPPARCEGCGRPVFHGVERARRTHTFCSSRCVSLVNVRARQAEHGEI
jgi:hypothetical protein